MTRTRSLLLMILVAGILPGTPSAGAEGRPSATVPAPREGAAHERFLLLNEQVEAHRGELDILFIGDSITQGWEGAGKKAWRRFYGHRKALNLGISGDRTQHVLWRLDNGNVDGLSPRVTVLMIGTNNSAADSTGEMLAGVTAVVDKIRKKIPGTKILLLGIFPRGEEFNEQRGKITQVNQALRKLHDDQAVFFIDPGYVFLEADGSISEEIMPDALHLSSRGYQLWAEAMEPFLSHLLQLPR